MDPERKVSFVLKSAESLLLTSFQSFVSCGGRRAKEGKNRRKWGGKFSYYISLGFFHFSFIFEYFFLLPFSLWRWYGKLRGGLWLGVEFFHIIFVSFSPKKKRSESWWGERWTSGNGILGNWSTSCFHISFSLRIASMSFEENFPPFCCFYFTLKPRWKLSFAFFFYEFIIQGKKRDE